METLTVLKNQLIGLFEERPFYQIEPRSRTEPVKIWEPNKQL